MKTYINSFANRLIALRRRFSKVIDRRINQRLISLIDERIDQRLVEFPNLNIFKTAGSWASCLQPGQISPNALFGSSLCRMEDMQHPRYQKLCREALHKDPVLHRKEWEFIYIIEKLKINNCLIRGSRGLGFGVGTEPLTSYFVSQGCEILATDAPEDLAEEGWKQTAQHASLIDHLWHPNIVDEQTFRKNCSFKPLDMNNYTEIPKDFNFHWSSCVIEHLGGIQKAHDFILESAQRLAPGGIGVHTTEFNLSSDRDTVDQPGTCILRGSDINRILESLRKSNIEFDTIVFDPGQHPYNYHVDAPPYSEVHLRVQLEQFTATSIGLVVRKPI